jgi:hypothetical protein
MKHNIPAPTREVLVPSAAPRKPRLKPHEREIVLIIADDEQLWRVFTDSTRAASTRLKKVARALGMEIAPCGEGVEFKLPRASIRSVGPRPVSPARRAHLARLNAVSDPRQKAIPGAADPIDTTSATSPGSRAEAGADLAEIRLSSNEPV